MTHVRVAVVGLGEAGYEMHLPALAGMAEVELCGMCDPDADRRTRASRRWRAPVFEDSSALLLNTNPDVVIIATPPDSHTALCLDAFAAGANVICEKPFVPTIEDADRVIEAAASAGKQIALNHEFRAMPIFDAVLSRARNDVYFAQVWQHVHMPAEQLAGWRRHMAHRTLHEAGVHLVDYAIALFGERPRAVHAVIPQLEDDGADPLSTVTLEFSRGRIAHVVQNRLSRGETQYFEVRAETNTTTYRASFGGRARITAGLYRSTKPHLRWEFGVSGVAWSEQGHSRKLLARNPRSPRVAATQVLLERSLAAFENATAPPASAQDGRVALEVVNACYASALSGHRVILQGERVTRARTPAGNGRNEYL